MELTTITLTKPWGGHEAGDTLEVDPFRHKALASGGYLELTKKTFAATKPESRKTKKSRS